MKKPAVFLSFRIDPNLKADLDRASTESGVPRTTIVRTCLRDYLDEVLPPYDVRKQLREATLAVGRKRGSTK